MDHNGENPSIEHVEAHIPDLDDSYVKIGGQKRTAEMAFGTTNNHSVVIKANDLPRMSFYTLGNNIGFHGHNIQQPNGITWDIHDTDGNDNIINSYLQVNGPDSAMSLSNTTSISGKSGSDDKFKLLNVTDISGKPGAAVFSTDSATYVGLQYISLSGNTMTMPRKVVNGDTPNLFRLIPTFTYNSDIDLEFAVTNLANDTTNYYQRIGVGSYSAAVPPFFDYAGANGGTAAADLYGTTHFSMNSRSKLINTQSMTNFEVVYSLDNLSLSSEFWSQAYNSPHIIKLRTTSSIYNNELGVYISLYKDDTLLHTVFGKAHDQANPSNTLFEIFWFRPNKGNIQMTTIKGPAGEGIQIQGYDVGENLERLSNYKKERFRVNNAFIGKPQVYEPLSFGYIYTDISQNTQPVFRVASITTLDDSSVNIKKTYNNLIGWAYSEKQFNIAENNYVITLDVKRGSPLMTYTYGGNMFVGFTSKIVTDANLTNSFKSLLDNDTYGTGMMLNFQQASSISDLAVHKHLMGAEDLADDTFAGKNDNSLSQIKIYVTNGILSYGYYFSPGVETPGLSTIDLMQANPKDEIFYLSVQDGNIDYGGFDVTLSVDETPNMNGQLNILKDPHSSNTSTLGFNGKFRVSRGIRSYITLDDQDAKVEFHEPVYLDEGLRLPKKTGAEIAATPYEPGLVFYNTTLNTISYSTTSSWVDI